MNSSGTVTNEKAESRDLTADEARKLPKLLEKAQAGDTKALDEVRPLLDKSGLWDLVGSLSSRVETSWLETMTGRNKLVREGYERQAATMRRELLETGDSPLERLLVDRVVLTWMQASHADIAYSSALKGDGHSFKEGTYNQERQDRANARHLKAVKALASVRRLLVPAVQVNIGRNQIISQGTPPAMHGEPQP